MPGAGKTILASVVIKHLQSLANASGDICVAFVFCRYTERMEVRDILAALVRQLVESYPRLRSLVEPMWEEHQTQSTVPTQQELLGVVQQICATFRIAYFTIDGLDEALPDDQFNLLQALRLIKANFLLTSRPVVLLQDVLPQAAFFEIIAHEEDIKLLVDQRIESSPDLHQLLERHSAKREVSKQICSTSHGMFLQASLLVENIRHCTTLKSVMRRLQQPAEGLSALYLETFERINRQPEERAALAKRALTWVVYAQDLLSVDDLRYAVVEDPENDWEDPTSFAEESTIVSACCGLVTVEEHRQLVDYTAFETLRRILDEQDPAPHLLLSRITVQRLVSSNIPDIASHPSHEHPPHATSARYKQWLATTLNATPLLSYSYDWWHIHSLKSLSHPLGPESPQISHVLAFFAICKAFPARLNLGGRRGFDHLTSPIHLVAHYGLTPLISLFRHDIHERTRAGRTALILAACQDDLDTVQEILALKGVDVNAQDNEGYTALMSAAHNGCLQAVGRLVETPSVDVNLRGNEGQTALLCCISSTLGTHDPRKVESALRLLSAPGVNVNIPDAYGTTAFMKAVRIYPVRVLSKFIAQHQVELWKCDPRGQSILIYAWQAESDTFRWILDLPGVDAALKEESGITALMSRAGSRAQQPIEDFLLDFRALLKAADNLNERDEFGLTALCHAVVRGNMAAIEALLQLRGIDHDPRDCEGRTLLMLAAMHNRDSQMLHRLQRIPGADVDTIDNKGRTALMLAVQTFIFNPDLVRSTKWLLGVPGINANARDRDGLSALLLALAASVLRTARTLLRSEELVSLVHEKHIGGQERLLVLRKGSTFRLRKVTPMRVVLKLISGLSYNSRPVFQIMALIEAGDGLVVGAQDEVSPTEDEMNALPPTLKFPWTCGWIAEEFDAPVQLMLNHPGIHDLGFGYLRRSEVNEGQG
ncbi:ankyrin repeat-containing domain protein [Coprinopsis sp. MPI-PUGE-AT-0042]|nr:ankyrin repeat-containing domain protein [Coprinopsis sp. MPI-PUGE-AT-0042]